MKKILLTVPLLLIFASMSYANTYTCYRYINGEPTGNWIKIKADSKSEARQKAFIRWEELGVRADSCNCKY